MRNYISYFTPDNVAQKLVDLAGITRSHNVLDPSAGTGQLIKAISKHSPCSIVAIENNPIYFKILEETFWGTGIAKIQKDFMDAELFNTTLNKFDRIVANPPFTNDVWFYHILKMYELLQPTGRMVCIVPKVFLNPSPLLEFLYYAFCNRVKAEQIPLENWAINSNGSITDIEILVINKV